MNNKILASALKKCLGSVFGLYLNTHAAHWNIEGIDFESLHSMFGTQYLELWESLDTMAEQIRQIDAYAPQTISRMLELNTVPDLPSAPYRPVDILEALLQGHEIVIELLTHAEKIAAESGRVGLSNYLGGRLEAHSKHRWFLRASSKRAT